MESGCVGVDLGPLLQDPIQNGPANYSVISIDEILMGYIEYAISSQSLIRGTFACCNIKYE